MFYLTTHTQHIAFTVIWLYMVKDHLDSEKGNRCCEYMDYSFQLAARGLLYVPLHRQVSTHNGRCYTSHEALAEIRNISMGPPHEGLIRRPIAS